MGLRSYTAIQTSIGGIASELTNPTLTASPKHEEHSMHLLVIAKPIKRELVFEILEK